MPETDPTAEPRVARERGDRLAADNAAVRLRLAELEREQADRDDQIGRLIGALNEAARRIGDLDRRRAVAEHRAELAAWEHETLRLRRWSRLGPALAALRRRPLAPRSYRRVREALRSVPLPPEPPAEPARTRRPDVLVAETEPIEVTPAAAPDGPVNRPGLVAAVVLGPVLEANLRYEWTQVAASGGWRETFEERPPDLLLVESVRTALPVAEMAAWCRERGVPTAYWDTGDGLGDAAGHFDHVFTVDAAAVPEHRRSLGHDRVHHLPFAAQPRLHNPTRVQDHGRYPLLYEGEYDQAAEPLIAPAPRLGAHFFATGFPRLYRQRVAPPRPYEEAVAIRKRFRVLIAPGPRLAYEAAAAGVPVVHHRADASPAFGPAVEDDTKAAQRSLRALLRSPELRDRQAHLALRRVHAEHTYRHRVDSLLEHLGTGPAPAAPPTVSLVLSTCRAEQIASSLEQIAAQVWRPLQLVLVLHRLDLHPRDVEKQAIAAGIDDIVVRSADASMSLGECLNLGIEAADGAYIGKVDDDELYGPHYVSDLLPAFSYTDAGVVGKLAHYALLESMNATVLRYPEHEHRYVDVVRGGALLGDGDLMRTYRFADRGCGEDTDLFRRLRADGVRVYAADRFSFVTIRHADATRHTWRPSDLELLDSGRLALYGLPKEHILF
ncbi:glycosyltransferase family protein [Actinomadura montaniterrae]|uniref:Glycosyltransferase n=1 Tax=Actinomadura montaniterrae TaxID=1803903 RepID=A0A6L3VYP6_9ACTN|nr:glycosyltransferase [Actinomadura montaniterrae]KAB2380957.1 glycosyltransferase [Actinomadura montaniterrae]